MRVHSEKSTVNDKGRRLTRKRPCRHLVVGLPASRIVRKLISVTNPVHDILLWQPELTNVGAESLREGKCRRRKGCEQETGA